MVIYVKHNLLEVSKELEIDYSFLNEKNFKSNVASYLKVAGDKLPIQSPLYMIIVKQNQVGTKNYISKYILCKAS